MHPGAAGKPKRNHRCRVERAITKPAKTGPDGEVTGTQKPAWTLAEDQMIMHGVCRLGPRWNEIAQKLTNRSSAAVRCRWLRLQRLSTDSAE